MIQVVKDFMQDWLQTTRDSLERSVLPLLPDPAAREQVTGHFRSRLDWLDGLGTRKLEMAFLKDQHLLGASLVPPLKRDEGAPYQEEEEAQARLDWRRQGVRPLLGHVLAQADPSADRARLRVPP